MCYSRILLQQSKHTKALKTEKEKFRMYVVGKYIDYVKNYTNALERRFPTAVKMYRVFSVGIKDFLRDLKTYISLRIKITRDGGFSNMSRQDIELYEKMPSDMCRIAPVLILSAIPFGNYIIFPLAFLKPKKLLCSHFWSIQQRLEFTTQDLTERLKYNKPVFRALQAKLDVVPDGETKECWRRVLGLLGSGVHPTPLDVLKCKSLFVEGPYNLSNLTYSHAGYLLKMYGMNKFLLKKHNLKYRAFILLEMDKAIIREGGVDEMKMESLRHACYIRGLNGSHLTNQDMRDWLRNWLLISRNVDKQSYSLLLHSPIFFAYNHPQNWVLIY
ncbi:LETM1 domain-containing protein 1 isoform X2 [Plodia interpunctella]|uniref:LETM1 domain-containing protein 1 isoform X2 n=1 Tax=Plodia interpunctella TaxID=58824 RepID=UPI002368783A|nr:LETM1 domain-containing protein 1 isoform X2 [Plodia interpunctella]